jgi:O-antigen/teichoic acid export membrane protein
MSTSIRRSAAIDSVSSLAARFAVLALNLATSIVIARATGPTGKGLITLVAVTAGQVMTFVSFGVDTSLVHYAGRRTYGISELGGLSVRLALLFGPLGTVLGLLFVRYTFASSIPPSFQPWAGLVFLGLSAELVSLYFLALLSGAGRILERNVLLVFRAIFDLLSASTAIVIGWNVKGILALTFAGDIIFALVAGVVLALYGLAPKSPLRPSSGLRQLLTFGLKGHVGTILQGVNYRLDVFLLAIVLHASDVGIYSVAVTTAELLGTLPSVFGLVLLQRSAVLQPREATSFTSLVNRLTFGAMVVGAVMLAVVGGPLIHLLFGRSFAHATTPLEILLPGIVALGVWRNLIFDLSGRGQPEVKSYTATVAAVLTVILDVLLIPRIGIIGAATASSVAYAAGAITAVSAYRRHTGATFRDLFVLKRGDITRVAVGIRTTRAFLTRPK